MCAATVGIVCKRAGVLFGWNAATKTVVVTQGTCDSWACPECAKMMRDRWSLRAQIGVRQFLAEHQFVDFVTLTSHEKLMNFQQTERVWREAWPPIYNAIKRRNPDFQYMIIPEKHKNGRMHVHALWTAGTPKRELIKIVRSRGLGYKLDVSAIVSSLAAQKYVIKYVGKSLGEDVPKKFHRVRVSQDWPVIPRPETPSSNLKWEYTRSEQVVFLMLREAQEKHFSVINQHSGENFDIDDIDFSIIQ